MISFDLGNLKADMEIVGYDPNKDDWCGIDFHVYGNGIDIHIDSNLKSILNFELEMVTKFLGRMLDGKPDCEMPYDLMESDFDFEISSVPKCLIIRVNILNGKQNTPHYLDVYFNEANCALLYDYLINEVGISYLGDSDYIEISPVKDTFRYIKVVFNDYSSIEYSYLDENRIAACDSYVWVPVGRDNIPKLAYVVDMKDYEEAKVPYPLEKTKKVLRTATDEEVAKAEENW